MIVFALGGVTWFILIVLVIALGFVFYKLSQSGKDKGESQPPEPTLNAAEADIRHAKVGDIVSISGFSDEYDDVEKKNRYESGGEEWFELLGVYKGQQVWIEWEYDDALEITATSPDRKLKLSSLNVTEDDLGSMDEEESRDNFVIWQEEKFFYIESCEVFFFKDCKGSGEGFYLWDFEAEDSETRLSIEKWEGEPFSAFTGKHIKPFNVRVYPR